MTLVRLCKLSLGVVTALITVAAAPAQAAGDHHRVPVGNTPADIPADVCGFPVHIGIVEDREYVVSRIENADGSISTRVAGPLVNSLTNLDTGASIVYDNGGPGTITTYPDGHATLDFQGHSMAWVRAAYQARLGTPALRLISGGRVRGVMNAAGDIVELSTVGHVLDGCALLS
ncbi:hypothetical protein [Kribbella kalugense]|uniref:Uncharacterized protein n=1 Tax=Kribbella kalugense TaxID=2512221 RepID=A0A4R7ZD01_9ACTN|nr:hypothetical protein [Kribbella kalugense]TDW15082.1 hypothetical protein EV650_6564 [Kribbella kalugense]